MLSFLAQYVRAQIPHRTDCASLHEQSLLWTIPLDINLNFLVSFPGLALRLAGTRTGGASGI